MLITVNIQKMVLVLVSAEHVSVGPHRDMYVRLTLSEYNTCSSNENQFETSESTKKMFRSIYNNPKAVSLA